MENKRNRINKKYSTHKNKVIFIKKKLPTMKKKTRHNKQTIDKQTMDKSRQTVTWILDKDRLWMS